MLPEEPGDPNDWRAAADSKRRSTCVERLQVS
jgi:hypothetical protein